MHSATRDFAEQLPPRWMMLLYKTFYRPKYRKLRDAEHRARILGRITRYAREHYRLEPALDGQPCTFKHSGNAGDLIYSLPALRELTGSHPAHLQLALNVPLRNQQLDHPLGGVMLNQGMFDRLAPLLRLQDYIGDVSVHQGNKVDYDLDVFRDSPMPLEKLNISRWYFYFHGISVDLSEPWLQVSPDSSFGDKIIIARSMRYRNTGIDYSILAKYPNLVFVGLENEYLDMKRVLPSLTWHRVPDFLDLARAIAGCRLFIGNQSFPFSLAEALKVPRILETDPLGPNVVPAGKDAYDMLFQKQFEHLCSKLLAQPSCPPSASWSRPSATLPI